MSWSWSCASFLRRIGLLTPKRATISEVTSADVENVVRENEKAFEEITQVYKELVSDTTNRLKASIGKSKSKSDSPFADLENLMNARIRRNKQQKKKEGNGSQ